MKPHKRTPTPLLLLLLTPHAPTTAAAQQCFYPDGSASSDVPCDGGAKVSSCCPRPGLCLSSGLCRRPNTRADEGVSYKRGTCTDPDWASEVCPQMCRINPNAATNASAYDFGAGPVQVWECSGEGYAEPAAYCCESARERTACCETQSAVFSLQGASIGNALAVQTFPVSSSETSTENSGTSSTGTTTATPVAETGTGTSTPTALPGSGSGEGGLSEGAKMGLGIGIGIGVAALISAAILIWYWMRSRTATAATAPVAPAAPAAPAAPRHRVPRSSGKKRWQAERVALIRDSPNELDSDQGVFEMHTAENRPAELYALSPRRMWRTPNAPELHASGENGPAEMYVGSPKSYFTIWR